MPSKKKTDQAAQPKAERKTKSALEATRKTRPSSKSARKVRFESQASILTSILTSTFRDKGIEKASEKERVTFRPTAKALQIKTRERQAADPLSEVKQEQQDLTSCTSDAIHDKLPLEILTEICRLVVLETDNFIYPVSTTGKEQPDLAMTCNAIRSVVLPLFYGLNTFAVELYSPLSFRRPSTLTNRKIRKWLSAIHLWSHHIRRWVFTCEDAVPMEYPSGSLPMASGVVLLSIRLPPPDPAKDNNSDSLAAGVSSSSSPVVEVHKDKLCLQQHGINQCELQQNPDWLNQIVISNLGIGSGYSGVMTVVALEGLQRMLGEEALELVELHCNGDAQSSGQNGP